MTKNNLETVDIIDLVSRYDQIIKEYVNISIQIAPLLDKFGKYRKELEVLTVEFVRRGYTPNEPDALKKLIEEEIQKRGTKIDVP